MNIFTPKPKQKELVKVLVDTLLEIIETINEKDIIEDLLTNKGTRICDKLKKYFDMITGFECCVCIKTTHYKNKQTEDLSEDLNLYTLCRDAESTKKGRGAIDVYSKNNPNAAHSVFNNTDFMHIWMQLMQGKFDSWHSNDLKNEPNYLNSSKIFYTHLKEPLPYKSSISVPICSNLKNTEHSGMIVRLWGYLCIDCNESGRVFDKERDKPVLQSISMPFFNFICKEIIPKQPQ